MALVWMAVTLAAPGAHAAGDELPPVEGPSVSITQRVVLILQEESFSLGVAYVQASYKTSSPNVTSRALLTDNGAFVPTLEFNTREKIILDWPLRLGNAILGWNINASASYFDVHYQLVNSAFRGDDIGTKVTGAYLGVAPSLFLKIGPLYPGKNMYWKLAYGIGPGVFQSSGTAEFWTLGGGVVENVGSSTPAFALYNAASVQFQVEHWYFDIMGKWLVVQDGGRTTFESYGFGAAYRFDW